MSRFLRWLFRVKPVAGLVGPVVIAIDDPEPGAVTVSYFGGPLYTLTMSRSRSANG